MRALLLLLALPLVFWTQSTENKSTLVVVTASTAPELAGREMLPAPGVAPRAGVASPTRAPWIVANGWRVMRNPAGKYAYDLPAGKAALAIAEAFAYGADAVLKIDPSDKGNADAMMSFLSALPAADLPPVADMAVVDDGSPITGEVMNLLARRNLLFKIVKTPAKDVRLNVTIGSPEFPAAEAADPSAFALKIRHQLTDDQRTLRVYGSEVVICRVTGDANRLRLQLLNYGGRSIQGLRIRLRGTWRGRQIAVDGTDPAGLGDLTTADGATEFGVNLLPTYAMVDLNR
jgi:hypothetical protein